MKYKLKESVKKYFPVFTRDLVMEKEGWQHEARKRGIEALETFEALEEVEERVEVNTDMSDEMFASMYDNTMDIHNIPSENHMTNVNDIFQTGAQSKNRFKVPRYGFKKR